MEELVADAGLVVTSDNPFKVGEGGGAWGLLGGLLSHPSSGWQLPVSACCNQLSVVPAKV